MPTPPLSVNQLLCKAKASIKRGDLAGAKRSYQSILERYPGNQQAKAGLKSLQSLQSTSQGTALNQVLEHLIALYNQGKLQELIQKAIPLAQQYPDSPLLWNILGAAHFQLGGLNQAADCYTNVIQLNPKNAEAHNNLGTVFNDLGQHEEAIQYYNKALQYKPDYVEAYNNLGNVFKNLERYEEAIQSYNKALQYQSNYAEAHHNLGIVFNNLEWHEEAIQSYNKALQHQPDHVKAYNNLGNVFNNLGRHEEAIQSYNKALKYQPEYAEAHHNLGVVFDNLGRHEEAIQNYNKALQYQPEYAEAHYNLGVVFNNLNRHEEAIQSYNKALQHQPDYAEAYNNLGNVFKNLARHEEAIKCYNKALQYKPDYVEAYNNLGNVFKSLERYEEAIQSYNKALQYQPDYAGVHNNLGNVFDDLGRYEEAIQSYNKALQHQPDYVDSHHHLAFVFLRQGKLAQGWQEYEWRLKKKEYRIECYGQDPWNGKDSLQGKTILLITEQGLGDTIQFCRYAKLLEQQGATVILSVPDSLQRLMQVLSPTLQIVIRKNIPRQFDTHCPLMSLPYLLQTELDTIPADDIPYLSAEPERQAKWQALLDSNDYKIGIAWQGSKKHKADHLRSFPLFHFEGLSKLAGVRLISLQKEEGVEQIAQYRDRVDVVELGQEYDLGDFIDTAAIITCLDLVITPDSAIAHLAGALGIKTWVLLPYVSEWRWLEERTDSPWYPGMRLFRQAAPGDWAGVFKQVEKTLISQVITEI